MIVKVTAEFNRTEMVKLLGGDEIFNDFISIKGEVLSSYQIEIEVKPEDMVFTVRSMKELIEREVKRRRANMAGDAMKWVDYDIWRRSVDALKGSFVSQLLRSFYRIGENK